MKIKTFAEATKDLNLNYATKEEFEAFEALYNSHNNNSVKMKHGELSNAEYTELLLAEFTHLLKKRREVDEILNFIAEDFAELSLKLRNNLANDN